MGDQAPVEAVVAAFKTPDGASQALAELTSVGGDVLRVKEAAVLVRDADNKLKIKESHHVGKGAVVGGVAGAPGTSALVVIVEHRWVLDVEQRLRAAAADVMTEAVRADVAAQLEKQSSTGS